MFTCPKLVARLLIWITRLLPLHKSAQWPLKRIIGVAYLKSRSLPLRLQNYQNETTGETIVRYCGKHSLPHIGTTLQCEGNTPSFTLHEIEGNAIYEHFSAGHSGPVLFYFHGGGYVRPINGKGQLPFVFDCARTANASKIWILEYTLAPDLLYPGQLVQAATALRYLVNERLVSPDHIILGGDSAGGHLALSLLAHFKSPKLGVPSVNDALRTPVRAVYLLSPWVTLKCSTESFRQHSNKDMITPTRVQGFISAWKPVIDDKWAELLHAGTPDLWSNLPAKRILVTAGTFEAFRDDIVAITRTLQANNMDVSLSLGENEIHVQSAVDLAVGLPLSRTGLDVLQWLKNM